MMKKKETLRALRVSVRTPVQFHAVTRSGKTQQINPPACPRYQLHVTVSQPVIAFTPVTSSNQYYSQEIHQTAGCPFQ